MHSWPPGFVFAPTDVEIIMAYLRKKVDGQPRPEIKIREVNIYAHHPEELAATYEPLGRSEWYFFTPRTRRHANGQRPDRSVVGGAHRRATATANGGDKETKSVVREGHWKATAGDKEIKFEGRTVGYRKSLVFYRGNKKTNWIMYEYRVADPPRRSGDIRFHDNVICRIHNKDVKITRGSKRSGDEYCRSDYHQHNPQKDAINQFTVQCPQQQVQQPIMQLPGHEYPNAMFPGDNLQALPDHQAGTDVAVPNNDPLMQSLDFSTLDDDQWDCVFDTTDDDSAYFDSIMDLLQD